ncbi:MAG TPA: type II toxin-antitoxin system RelE/ParE family toxin [Flavobacteriales bacterium]|nr:type II toxin-antitoxin system RelE/ParE family toxin [Flavobacteriales bacterium]
MKTSVLVYSSLALEDVARIFDWYEEQQKGLGHRFLDCLQKTGDSLKKVPFGFQNKYKTTQESTVHPFPYVIIYTIENNIVYVNSIFPTKMHPQKKYLRFIKQSKRKR